MKPLSEFYSRLLPLVPGCPQPTMDQALLDSAIALCEDALCVRGQLDQFTTVAGQSQYPLDAPTDQSVSRVMHVIVDGWPVEVAPYERVSALADSSGAPRIAYTIRDGADLLLVLYPTPDAALPVRVTAALRPLRSATTVEDILTDRWVEGVVYGAAARVSSIPSQPFSSPEAAASYMSMSLRSAAKARAEGSYGSVRGQMRVTQRPFA